MGTGPPRLRRRLIGTVSLLAAAGLLTAPVSRADTGIGVAPALAAVDAAVDPVVPTAVEPVVEPVVGEIAEPVARVAEAPAALPAPDTARVQELVDQVSSAATPALAVPALPAVSRPKAIVAAPRPLPPHATHARQQRAAPVEVAPRRGRESSSGAAARPDRREPAITRDKPVAIPLVTAPKQPEVQQTPGPQRFPAPSQPVHLFDATGVAPGFVLVFLAAVISLFLVRSGRGARIASLLASPRGAALALELERPG